MTLSSGDPWRGSAQGRQTPPGSGHAPAPGEPSRLLASRLLAEVLAGRSLSEAGSRLLPGLPDPRDRALAQELCYGVMRWYPRLDHLLGLLLRKPLKAREREVKALLLIGLYQIIYLRVADHAAVHATTEAAKRLRKPWAPGLINGVLRNFQRRREALLAQLDGDDSSRYAMPGWLLGRLRAIWPGSWQERIAALNERPPMSLRVNCARTTRAAYLGRLTEAGLEARPLPLNPCGLVLERPLDVERLPGFGQGLCSVQDGGAQLAAPLLAPRPGQRVLDACAAPGGKTAHLLESVAPLQLTALDLDPQRLERVGEGLQRLGLEAELAVGDAARPQGPWAQRQYDRILLDLPCSATGVMRRHPDIKFLRQARDIPPLVKKQGQILHAIWPLLRPGGVLLYVTCSILPEENEEQLTAFLAQHPDAREQALEVGWGEPRAVGRQIAPGEQEMDGFYYARLGKLA